MLRIQFLWNLILKSKLFAKFINGLKILPIAVKELMQVKNEREMELLHCVNWLRNDKAFLYYTLYVTLQHFIQAYQLVWN